MFFLPSSVFRFPSSLHFLSPFLDRRTCTTWGYIRAHSEYYCESDGLNHLGISAVDSPPPLFPFSSSSLVARSSPPALNGDCRCGLFDSAVMSRLPPIDGDVTSPAGCFCGALTKKDVDEVADAAVEEEDGDKGEGSVAATGGDCSDSGRSSAAAIHVVVGTKAAPAPANTNGEAALKASSASLVRFQDSVESADQVVFKGRQQEAGVDDGRASVQIHITAKGGVRILGEKESYL